LDVELDLLLTLISATIVALGSILAYVIYRKPYLSESLARRIEVSRGLHGIYNFLYDRWYLNAIYYAVFVHGGKKLSNGLFSNWETKVMDRFYNSLIVKAFTGAVNGVSRYLEKAVIDRFYNIVVVKTFTGVVYGASKFLEKAVIDRGYNIVVAKIVLAVSHLFRKSQTGKINQYLLVLLSGFLFLLLLLLLGVI
jgi:NADH-quinone oxidoreductase subunit L